MGDQCCTVEQAAWWGVHAVLGMPRIDFTVSICAV